MHVPARTLAAALALLVLVAHSNAQVLVTLEYATSDCSGPVITATATMTNVCFSALLVSSRTVCAATTYSVTAYEGGSCTGSVVGSLTQPALPLNHCTASWGGSSRKVCDGSANAQLAAAVWSDVTYGASTTLASTCTDPPYMATYQIASCVTTGNSYAPSKLYNCSQQAGAQTTSFKALGCTGGAYQPTSQSAYTCSYNSQKVCGYVALAAPPFWDNPLFVPIVSAAGGLIVLIIIIAIIACCVRSRRRKMAVRRAAAQASIGLMSTPYVQLQGGVAPSHPVQYVQSGAVTYAAPVVVVRD